MQFLLDAKSYRILKSQLLMTYITCYYIAIIQWRDVLVAMLCDKVYQLLVAGLFFYVVLRFPSPIKLTAMI